MNGKIKVLFYNLDQAGVQYFRSQTPAMELEKMYGEDFHVEFNQQIDFNDPEVIEYLKSFHIIHYHRQLHPNVNEMMKIAKILKENGTTLIMDVDDYWYLHKKHPLYSMSIEKQMHVSIIQNLKIADYVTTTTELFAEKIKEVTGKDNVIVLYNSIDPDIMKQFRDKWKPNDEGKVRIIYAAGSSHAADVEQLRSVMNVLYNDPELKDKFKVILAGWDTAGTTTEIKFNQDFGNELQVLGLWNQQVVNIINKTKGDVDAIPNLPNNLKDKYRGKVFETNQREIKSEESIYLRYEEILTDNHNIIKDKDYLEWLMNFERDVNYPGEEGNFGRRWTQKANVYAKVLDEADIVIAPLEDNEFNRCKSSLKQIECWTRKLPVVCSDIPPYNVDGKHMENCVLIPNKKNAHKYWKKYLKQLILDEDLRKKLGEQLYEDFKDKYHLKTVTKKRAEFYKEVVSKVLAVK
ncbi:MAG: glycosyltransferase [bacterium]